MDDTTDCRQDLVQLAKIALQGRTTDVVILLRKFARRYRATEQELADTLMSLIREAPISGNPMRLGESTGLPLDQESRVPLVRVLHTPVLETEPIYDDATWRVLTQVVRERQESDRLSVRGIEPTRTVLFTGPPGVGKTLAAKWIARELGRPLATLDLSTVMSSFLGRTGSNVRAVLDFCKDHDCVLLLDELDAVAKRRDDPTEIGELKRLVTVLLQEIDEWTSMNLLLAATNHENLLDSAVWRRFELVVSFPSPQPEVVADFLCETADVSSPKEWSPVLSRALPNFTFSDAFQLAQRVQRNAALHDTDSDTALEESLIDVINKLPRNQKRQLAVDLVDRGAMSQRRANRLTNVSRDTIRKYRETETGGTQDSA